MPENDTQSADMPQPSRRVTRRLCSMVLWSQMLVMGFAAVVGRALTVASMPQNADVVLWIGLAISAACVVAAIAVRFRRGELVGWAVQVATFAYAFVVPMMVLVGAIFTGLWLVAVRKGAQMDALTDEWIKNNASLQA
ncbi:DUF4233 domain-containing protein [Dermatophilus congolensis]|nr:DUF4233 domain-containing protein [Dermatophilus congolensis]MBO3129159.1 DUF4233 domain-containing protein [Dermatophilus congolensis]MBO3132205.1 DUF4233 domain-containing protein [Dermatophilus congolensis]MBO3133636.1 DUF4233 domain-containing protein [Dermatophilus congolensis]MBO3135869.1 DUF4233 domain-containing protein [Dermatophilus congolensis]MBO3138109.1 DUF4233 domain-containing protein [Dermatophilus congolensis]